MHGTTATIPPESPPFFAGAHEALTIDLSLVERLSCLGGSQLNCLQLLYTIHYCDIACRKAWNRNKMWITVRLYVLPRAFAVTNVELAFPTC